MRCLTAALILTVPSIAIGQAESAQVMVPTVAQQVATAVLPLPKEFQEGATVMGYRVADKLEVIHAGTGPMICLADDPRQENFHVACYHDSLEPFMKRGRDLRASGITGSGVDSVRYAEVESGVLPMPNRAALWQMTGPAGSVDFTTTAVGEGVRALYVVYMPGATAESTGLPTTPGKATPWLMLPGTPKAHLMFIPNM